MRWLTPLFLAVVIVGGASAPGRTSPASPAQSPIRFAALDSGDMDSELLPGSGGTILFNSWATGEPHLWYAVRPDGSALRLLLSPRVTPDHALARLSPDGRFLLFAHGSRLYATAS